MAHPLPPGKKRCPEHGVVYGAIEQCSECRASRGAVVAPSSPKADTGAKRVHAARYRLNESACWSEVKTNSAADPNVAVKWSAESSKWARLATELEAEITEIEHDQWLREQKRLLGGDGS